MVLVCHDHPFVFLKTRKTAGTSVEMVLESLCVPPGQEIVEFRPTQKSEHGIVGARGPFVFKGWKQIFRHFEWRNHQSAAFVRRMIGRKEWDARAKITTVRNPFDRMVSYFNYSRRVKKLPAFADFSDARAAFQDFCHSRAWRDDRKIVHINGKFIIDHTVRFENLDGDLRSLAQKLDLPLRLDELPRTKVAGARSNAKDIPDYFDPALVEFIKTRLSWVFDHYDYPLEPQPRYAAA